MMLSQITPTVTAWSAFGGFITVVLIQIGKLLSDARKDKRDMLLEQQKQSTLERIADSNENAVTGLTEIKSQLKYEGDLENLRHQVVMTAISNVCKHKNNQSTNKIQ